MHSLTQVVDLIRRGEKSSVEVVDGCLARIAALDPVYHAHVSVLADEARAAARRADEDVRRGRPLGRLHGVPVTLKDAFLMRGTPTTLGTTELRAYAPSDQDDATCVRRLQDAGAIVLAKVNVGSGMSRASADGSRLESARNPWRLDHTPGGSSSGSAVSLAIGTSYGSVGTDLGGSIRIPAAFTGVVGLKPTYGRVSLHGDVFGMAAALEHVGPLTRTVADAALMLEVLSGPDPRDPTALDASAPAAVAAVARAAFGTVRLGHVRNGGPVGAEPDVRASVGAAVDRLAGAGTGIDVEEVTLPAFDETLWDEITLLNEWDVYDAQCAEDRTYLAYVRANLRRKRRKVMDHFGDICERIRAAYAAVFERVDLLALPTAPITAKPLGTWTWPWSGASRETMDLHLANCWMFNVTGHPAVSVPCGLSGEGLPVGLQLVGRHLREDLVLGVAAAYERAVGGFPMPPILDRV